MACCQAAGLHDNPCNGNGEILFFPSFDIEAQKPYNICGIYGTIASRPLWYLSRRISQILLQQLYSSILHPLLLNRWRSWYWGSWFSFLLFKGRKKMIDWFKWQIRDKNPEERIIAKMNKSQRPTLFLEEVSRCFTPVPLEVVCFSRYFWYLRTKSFGLRPRYFG